MYRQSSSRADWTVGQLSGLSILNREFYRALWSNGRLRSDVFAVEPDCSDEINARLVCTILQKRKQALIVLPGREPHRGPYLFTTGLILQTLSNKGTGLNTRGCVLYFGSTIGIRGHLSDMRVSYLRLDSVFRQARLAHDLAARPIPPRGRSRRRSSTIEACDETFDTDHFSHLTPSRYQRESSPEGGGVSLPLVLCVYSPADVEGVFSRYPPDWVAVDCGHARQLAWISSVLNVARSRGIPLVAWTRNPLSDVVDDFREAGLPVLAWPAITSGAPPELGIGVKECLRCCFGGDSIVPISPIIIDDPESQALQHHLTKAYVSLAASAAAASEQCSSRLASDTIRVGWRYLRALEGLAVPAQLHDSEAKNLWGASSLGGLQVALGHLIDATSAFMPQTQASLADVFYSLSAAKRELESSDPPLWLALSQLCVKSYDNGTVITFPSRASREMFSFGLLAYHNITADDLRELDVWPVALSDLYDLVTSVSTEKNRKSLGHRIVDGRQWDVLFVGLPSKYASSMLDPLVRGNNGFWPLILPYQGPVLARRIEQWDAGLFPSLTDFADGLSNLLEAAAPPELAEAAEAHLLLVPGELLRLGREGSIQRKDSAKRAVLWKPHDPLDEVSRLIRANLNAAESEGFSTESDGDPLSTHALDMAEHDSIQVLDEAIEVRFKEPWRILLGGDDLVQVILTQMDRGTAYLDERHASALRPGDRVLFIQGRHHQDLYDLIISRIHQRPGINLHVKLIQRWRDDLGLAYRRRKQQTPGWGIPHLLEELHDRGSNIVSTLTLRNWLNGQTIAPEDPQDLRRLAEIMDLEFVRQHYRRINGAAQRLRGIHRGLGIRLHSWIREQIYRKAGQHPVDDILDKELGLTFADFRDSLQILTVSRSETKVGPFVSDSLGQLERMADHE